MGSCRRNLGSVYYHAFFGLKYWLALGSFVVLVVVVLVIFYQYLKIDLVFVLCWCWLVRWVLLGWLFLLL